MFRISRYENFTRYWWTGSDWSEAFEQAKKFHSEADAHAEMTQMKIEYTYSII